MDKFLYDYAISFIGKPYYWGGDDPMQGFDCSGLVIELLKSCGMLPRRFDATSQGLYNRFRSKSELRRHCQFGALCFYGRDKRRITHIAFGLDDKRILEAGGGNSRTKSEDIAIDQNAFVRVRPVASRSDLVAILMPRY